MGGMQKLYFGKMIPHLVMGLYETFTSVDGYFVRHGLRWRIRG